MCGNNDSRYFGIMGGVFYCRKRITFIGGEETGDIAYPKSAHYKLDYDLTEDQMRLSEKLIDNYKNSKNTLAHAVCGSPKTRKP